LQANVVRPWREGEDATPFKNALLGVAFKDGERYDDFKKGDKIAAGALAELITSQKGSAETSSIGKLEATSGMKAFWIGFAAIGFVGIAGVALIARKLKREKSAALVDSVPVPAAVAQQPASAPHPAKAFKLNVKPKPAFKPVNGNGHADRNGNNPKRKRMFDYHKFYTEMVLQGPAPVIAEPVNGYNGYPNGHDTDHARNGHSNGNGNGANGNGHSDSSGSVLNAHSELIASQKSLIEEQKRLIHEQARLIEEKSKLIAEKNNLLDRQSQMIDNSLL